jgi:PIN domain nuclease of toxin-antitoxin system
MTGILDTHAFIWSDADPSKLTPTAAAFIRHPANRVLVSVVSLWEIVIKSQLGKLSLNSPLAKIVADQQANGIEVLPVELAHVLRLESLPNVHKDPFDRLLIAQAMHEGAAIVSADAVLAGYPVNVIW